MIRLPAITALAFASACSGGGDKSAKSSKGDTVTATEAGPASSFNDKCRAAVIDDDCSGASLADGWRVCGIKASGDAPNGFNAIAKSACAAKDVILNATCTYRPVGAEDAGLVSCAAPEFAAVATDATYWHFVYKWTEKDGKACAGHEYTYDKASGKLQLGWCAQESDAELTKKTVTLAGGDKTTLEAALAALKAYTAPGEHCAQGYQTQIDASDPTGAIDEPYVVVKGPKGQKVLSSGVNAPACRKYDPDAYAAALAALAKLQD